MQIKLKASITEAGQLREVNNNGYKATTTKQGKQSKRGSRD